MYYIKNGLSKKWHFLAVFYAVFGVLTVFGTGNATQVNTIVSSVNTALMNFNILKGEPNSNVNLIFGIFIAALVAMVLLGGIKRIGQVSEKLVPFMAVLYVILALGVIILNIQRVPGVFAQIVSGAFTPRAATGGIIGSMFLSMKKGVSRGIFSNEAGLGTGSIAHACADTDNAVHQGMFGIFEVFMDTIVICTLTGLVILLAAPNISYGLAAGAELTISGFTATYGGWVSILTAIAMCCFAFSTIIGWGLYGSRCIEFLGGEKFVRPFFVGAFLGDITETIFCRITAGVWMSRSSVVWGPFSIVWGLAIALGTAMLYRYKDRSDGFLFGVGTLLGGGYEYLCSVFTEIVFGKVFWDYSKLPFNLGGRINLLYCFFWGIAAVVWFKKIYPFAARWIEKIPMKAGRLLTWVLIVFMCCNVAVSCVALVRYDERSKGIAAESSWQQWADEHYDDAKMAKIYPNAKVTK